MNSIAVVYQSKYGATKKYAAWIAEALSADLMEKSSVHPRQLMDYGLVIYGGGLYAGGISGVELVTKNPCRKLAVFTVGMFNPESTDYTLIVNRNFPPEMRGVVPVFPLLGSLDCKKLGPVHKLMMAGIKKLILDRKPESERTADDRIVLESFAGNVDLTDREAIAPIIRYAQDNFAK